MKKRIFAVLALAVAIAAAAAGISCAGSSCGGLVPDTRSAYQIAVDNGFSGTEAEWLESLKGRDGTNAQTVVTESLYAVAQKNGFRGSFDEFVAEYLGRYFEINGAGSVSAAADKAVLSVVSVYSTFSGVDYELDRGHLRPITRNFVGAGAGVVIETQDDGSAYIVTNFHVIYSVDDSDNWADAVEVYAYGAEIPARRMSATIIGATASYDLAVLKIEDCEAVRSGYLVAAEYAEDSSVGAGDTIFAVGNPEANGLAVTAGIVSVDSEIITMTSPKDERTDADYRVMRIDAAVNSGNSGGGLFDAHGRLVGIVNAKVISENIDNIAYAIPVSLVRNVAANIVRNCDGSDRSVRLTALAQEVVFTVTDSYAYYDEAALDTKIKETVAVASVSGGASGKLAAGDVLVAITYEGTEYEITRGYNVTDCLPMFKENTDVTFTVLRGGSEQRVTLSTGAAYKID